ncbi:MAG: putative ribosome maturation factor rimN [Bacteroidota bacterium]|nr:putative ribosome maturation factor rimN [Bacteroidota bacterium]
MTNDLLDNKVELSINNDIQETVSHLQKGNIILYPTDTIWGLGCDATNEDAIEKIFSIKQRSKEKNLIVLMDSVEMLRRYVDINKDIENQVSSLEVPTTVIYDDPKDLPRKIISDVNTMAIRITKHEFCKQLIAAFGKPLISTSANISGEAHPIYFEDISEEIKNKVDFIVPKEYDTSAYKQPSRLIKILPDNTIDFLR